MDRCKWIRINPDTEYSADFDFFIKNQIASWRTLEGTVIVSLIEKRTFFSGKNRDMTDDEKMNVAKQAHRRICNLQYGGTVVLMNIKSFT